MKRSRTHETTKRRLLRFVARSALLAAVVLCLPWLRGALNPASKLANGDELYLPILLADLNHRGHFRPDGQAVFLGDATSWSPFLEQNRITPVTANQLQELSDKSLDFVLTAGNGVKFSLIDRALKVGGVAAILPTSKALFQLPENYKVVYAHHAKAVAIAAKKVGSSITAAVRPHRRLLAVPEARKKEALNGLEGVLLEPPHKRQSLRRLRPKYLPELIGDSLEGYRRRVFIDVTPPGSGSRSAASWFQKYYPKGDHKFEIVRLKEAEAPVAAAKEVRGARKAAEGIGEWLDWNVREEDYVVVKAGVEAVEEMVRKGGAVVRRVDELFLECGEGDDAAGSKGRPYWECLALYGRLRDQGVAVHQWWGMLK